MKQNPVSEPHADTAARLAVGSHKTLPIAERHAITAGLAAEFTGISRTRIYELLGDGTIEGKIVRGRRLVLVGSLLRLLGESPSTAKHERAA